MCCLIASNRKIFVTLKVLLKRNRQNFKIRAQDGIIKYACIGVSVPLRSYWLCRATFQQRELDTLFFSILHVLLFCRIELKNILSLNYIIMKKVNKLLTLSTTAFLLFVSSCSNKTDKHISKMEDFVKKWEGKTSQGKLSNDETAEFKKDYEELKRSSYELSNAKEKPDFDQMKKAEELDGKISNIYLKAEYGTSDNFFGE